MNVSGILVIVPTAHVKASIENLVRLQGIEVHHCDPGTGRIVVTQEAESIQAEIDGLRRIKGLPHVILAEMVYHCFEGDNDLAGGVPAEPEEVDPVPPYLNV